MRVVGKAMIFEVEQFDTRREEANVVGKTENLKLSSAICIGKKRMKLETKNSERSKIVRNN